MAGRPPRPPGGWDPASRAWWAVVPVVVVVAAAVSQLRVTMQEQLISLVCAERQAITSARVNCGDAAVIREANRWVGAGQLGFGVSNLLMSSIWGSISDRYGRKLVMLLSMLGNLTIAFSAAYVGINSRLPWRVVLTAASIIGGLGGGTTITLMGAFAFVSDCCPPRARTFKFTLIEAFYGVGGLIAYLGGGYLSSARGETFTLYIIAAVLGVLCIYIALIPESLEPERQAKLQCKKLHTFGALSTLVGPEPCTFPTLRRTRMALVGAFTVAFLAFLGGFNVTTLFFKGGDYRWSDEEVGVYNAVSQAGRALTLLLAPVISRCALSDQRRRTMVMILLLVFGGCNISLPWVQGIITACTLGGVAGLMLPASFGYIRATVSRSVNIDRQGEALAALAFIESLDTLISAVVFNSLFDVRLEGLSVGATAFFAIGALSLLAAALLFAVHPSPDVLFPTERMHIANDADEIEPLLGRTNGVEPVILVDTASG